MAKASKMDASDSVKGTPFACTKTSVEPAQLARSSCLPCLSAAPRLSPSSGHSQWACRVWRAYYQSHSRPVSDCDPWPTRGHRKCSLSVRWWRQTGQSAPASSGSARWWMAGRHWPPGIRRPAQRALWNDCASFAAIGNFVDCDLITRKLTEYDCSNCSLAYLLLEAVAAFDGTHGALLLLVRLLDYLLQMALQNGMESTWALSVCHKWGIMQRSKSNALGRQIATAHTHPNSLALTHRMAHN